MLKLDIRSRVTMILRNDRVELAKQRGAERARERAEWEALQTQEAAAEADRLRADREAKRASFEAAEAKLKQELAERAAVERRLLVEKEARLREEREWDARWGRQPNSSVLV
jgi:hypothetical protein